MRRSQEEEREKRAAPHCARPPPPSSLSPNLASKHQNHAVTQAKCRHKLSQPHISSQPLMGPVDTRLELRPQVEEGLDQIKPPSPAGLGESQLPSQGFSQPSARRALLASLPAFARMQVLYH